MTLTEAVAAYVDVHRSGWTNAKHAAQWTGAIERHVLPTLGDVLVGDLTAGAVQDALMPSWRSCHVTSTRIRQRLEVVIAFCDIREGRDGRANPAQWRHRLSHLMPAPKAIRKGKPKVPHRALPWAEAPRLHRALIEDGGSVARALLFALHTVARTGEVVHATWSEIDDSTLTWSIPGWRMKARRPHLIALSPAARDALGERRARHRPPLPLTGLAQSTAVGDRPKVLARPQWLAEHYPWPEINIQGLDWRVDQLPDRARRARLGAYGRQLDGEILCPVDLA